MKIKRIKKTAAELEKEEELWVNFIEKVSQKFLAILFGTLMIAFILGLAYAIYILRQRKKVMKYWVKCKVFENHELKNNEFVLVPDGIDAENKEEAIALCIEFIHYA